MTDILCPFCGSHDTIYKKKARQWECNECERRFDERRREEPPRKIFLSYPHNPKEHACLVEDVANVLRDAGHEPWFDKNKLHEGHNWREEIARGLLDSDWLIIFMSEHSLRTDGVCLEEVNIALNHKVCDDSIIPVLLEDEDKVSPPPILTQIQWLDVSDLIMHSPYKSSYIGSREEWISQVKRKFANIIRHIEKKGDISGQISELRKILRPSSVIAKHTMVNSDFVGREWILEQIEDWRINKKQSNLFVLTGAAGIGKSAIASQLSQNRKTVVASYYCKHNAPVTRDPLNLIRTVAFQIASRNSDYRTWLLKEIETQAIARRPIDSFDAPEFFLNFIEKAPNIDSNSRERQLIVIDGLDEARESDGINYILNFISSKFDKLPNWLGVIITTRPAQEIEAVLQSTLDIDLDDNKNLKDIRSYLDNQLSKLTLSSHDPKRMKNAIDTAVKNSEGSMLYAVHLVKSFAGKKLDPDAFKSFPEGIRGIYIDFLNRVFGGSCYRFDDYKNALNLIVSSPVPAEETLLKSILNIENDELSKLLRPLSSLLRRETLNGKKVWIPFHKSFSDWLINPEKLHPYQVKGDGAKRICDAWYEHLSPSLKGRQSFNYEYIETFRSALPYCVHLLDIWNDAILLEEVDDWLYIHEWNEVAEITSGRLYELKSEKLGLYHPSTLLARNNLAVCLYRLGDAEYSASTFYELSRHALRYFGMEDRSTCLYLCNLAYALYKQGRYHVAILLSDFFSTLIEESNISERRALRLGAICRIRSLYELIYRDTKLKSQRLLSIEEQLKESYKLANPKLPDGHWFAKECNRIRVNILLDLERYNEALPLARDAVKQYFKSNSNNHDEGLFIKDQLISVYVGLGEFDSAVTLIKEIVKLNHLLEIAQPTNEKEKYLFLKLVDLLVSKGDVLNSIGVIKRVIQYDLELFHELKSDTLASLSLLVEVLYKESRLDTANELNLILSDYQLAVFDANFLAYLESLLIEQLNAKDLTSSHETIKKIIIICDFEFGEKHSQTIEYRNYEACILVLQSHYCKAADILRKNIFLLEQQFGTTHPKVIILMSQLSDIYIKGSLIIKGFEVQIELCKRILGPNNTLTFSLEEDLRNIVKAQDSFENGLNLFENDHVEESLLKLSESETLLKKHLGVKHPETLKSMYYLAVNLFRLGQTEKALLYMRRLYKICQKTKGANSKDTLFVLHGLSTILFKIGQIDEAEIHATLAYEGRLDLLGASDSQTLWTKKLLGTIYSAQRRLTEASRILEETLDTQLRVLGKEEPETIETIKELFKVYEELNNHDRARELQDLFIS